MKIQEQIKAALKEIVPRLTVLLKSGHSYKMIIDIGHSKIKEVKYLKNEDMKEVYKHKGVVNE